MWPRRWSGCGWGDYRDSRSRRSLRHSVATRNLAGRLAILAKSLETDGHDLQVIAGFLQRSLFTMFAEDVGLLPADGFKTLLARARENPHGFPVLISALWKEMATGTHSFEYGLVSHRRRHSHAVTGKMAQ